MWYVVFVGVFVVQCQLLMYVEVVLFVDDGQCQIFEYYVVLYQCMGVDYDLCFV